MEYDDHRGFPYSGIDGLSVNEAGHTQYNYKVYLFKGDYIFFSNSQRNLFQLENIFVKLVQIVKI